MKQELPPLEGQALRQLQATFRGVRYLIIDERSFVGQRMFYRIDSRLRQARPEHSHLPMGGVSVVLFGDDAQLPPVMDARLYAPPANDLPSIHGHQLYMQHFTEVIKLTRVHRQADGEFQQLLMRVRDSVTTNADVELLRQRLCMNLGEEEQQLFSRELHLFATREQVAQHNLQMLADMSGPDNPVARIEAMHWGAASGRTASADLCQGLPASLLLCVGARVMLRSNLSVEQGLVNGALGHVHAILYEEGTQPPSLPNAVLVQFDAYRGPSCLANVPGVVPIFPRTAHFSVDRQSSSDCSRSQLPLALAWAVTVHK